MTLQILPSWGRNSPTLLRSCEMCVPLGILNHEINGILIVNVLRSVKVSFVAPNIEQRVKNKRCESRMNRIYKLLDYGNLGG